MLPFILLAQLVGTPPEQCSEQTQTGLTACAAAEAKAAEDRLNQVYRALTAKLSAEDRQRLVAAERSWVDWRDKECVMRTGGGIQAGGTITPMLIAQCQRDLARARTTDLEDLLRCGPGDLSCPAK